jgi:hypothetical protein
VSVGFPVFIHFSRQTLLNIRKQIFFLLKFPHTAKCGVSIEVVTYNFERLFVSVYSD